MPASDFFCFIIDYRLSKLGWLCCCVSCLQVLNGRQLRLRVSAAQVTSNDFKNGMQIEMDGQPYKVVGVL